MKKLFLRLVSQKNLLKFGLQIIEKLIEKGIDKLDKETINGKDVRREDLEYLEEMVRYYLKK